MTFDETNGTFEGRSFPAESDWLDAEVPADLKISTDFVARTMAAVRAPTPAQLESFAVPGPSADFVSRTLGAVQHDRRRRWRELLARYVAPEPSAEFVSRTLRALAADSPTAASDSTATAPSRERAGGPAGPGSMATLRTWAMPLFAAAAVLIVAFLLPQDEVRPIELRAAETQPAAFGVAHATSPLPALLVQLDHDDDPYGLPNTGGDGVWLLMQRDR